MDGCPCTVLHVNAVNVNKCSAIEEKEKIGDILIQ